MNKVAYSLIFGLLMIPGTPARALEQVHDLATFIVSPTREPGTSLTTMFSNPGQMAPAGLAVDRSRNIYVTDQGDGSEAGGSILLFTSGQRIALRIARGLTNPGGIVLSSDQRAMIVAEPGGIVKRIAFGLSIRVTGITPVAGKTFATIKTDTGPRTAGLSPDGYFHFLNILTPEQTGHTVDVDIEHNGRTYPHFNVSLGQGVGRLYGQGVAYLAIEE